RPGPGKPARGRVPQLRGRPASRPGRGAAHLPAAQGSVRLRSMRVFFCGVGALGSHAATLCRTLPVELALAGFGPVERRNLLSQAFTRPGVGKNKAEVLRLQLRNFYGVEATAYPVRLTEQNIAQVCAGSDLLVDCLDNVAGRLVVLEHARASGIPSVHAGLAADGTFGLVRWGERFTPDAD